MKTCIPHPANQRMIIIRDWQIDFCDGFYCGAALLSFFEYWHCKKLEETQGIESVNPEDFYQYHTIEDLENGLLIYAKDTINLGIKLLIAKKAISVHKNPNSRYKVSGKLTTSFNYPCNVGYYTH